MAQAAVSQRYTGPVHEFHKWMRANVLYAVPFAETEERSTFLPISHAKAYLAENSHVRLDEILDDLFSPEEPPIDSDTILSNYTAMFCILVDMGHGAAIVEFVNHDHNDGQLPFDPHHEPPGLPPDTEGDFFEKFCRRQFRFCVPTFPKSMARHYGPDRILPVREKRKLADGGSAIIYEIKLHGPYNKLLGGLSTADPNDPLLHTFALKTYRSYEAARYYTCEVAAFRGLNRSPNPFLIAFYGNYTQGDTYNLILEYADQGSLEEYFKKHNPPDEEEDIVNFWTSLFNITKALASIHKAPKSNAPEAKVLNGWHQDVKPKNILVVSNNAASPYHYQFKLADLGISHFKLAVEGARPGTADDAYGTQTYGAPECYREDSFWDEITLDVGQKVDIWSYGCILSEAAVWMAKGYPGLLRYRQERAMWTEKISKRLGDCFHDGHTVLPVVHQWHEHIRSLLRNCDRITPGVLKLVKDYIFQVPDFRLDAKQLWGRVKQLIDPSPVGTFDSLSPSGMNMNVGPSMGSRVPHDSPPSQWYPDLSRPLAQTPTKQTNRFSGYNGPNTNGGHPIMSKTHFAEPDTFSTYAGETRGGLSYVSSGTRNNHTNGPYNRPMSQPEASVDRPEAQHFISDEQPHGRVLSSPFDNDPSRVARTNDIYLRGKVSALDKRNSKVPNQASASTSRTYAIRPGPSATGDLDEDDLYGASDNENEYRQVHQRGPSATSLPSSIQHHPPSWSSPHEGQPNRPNPNSSPTSIPSSPPPRKQSPPTPLSSAPLAQATASVTKLPTPDKGKVPGRSKRQAAANELPNLPLITAQEWRRVKKDNAKLRNIFKKREEPYLPGKFLLGRVGKRDHVFIIDDAETMRTHWDEMCQLFGILAYMVKETDEDGIDMYFTMTEKKYNAKDVSDLVDIVGKRKNYLEGHSNINLRLDQVLSEYNRALQNEIALRKAGSRYASADSKKPLTVYVFTNALWSRQSNPTKAIKGIVDSLVSLKCSPSRVGIQFISFGNNEEALDRLDHYDSGLGFDMDIVDHTRSNGNLWKMILGAIDEEMDADDEDDTAEHKSDG